jgi:hypothetical protein
VIMALAGRRIDTINADAVRFPLTNVEFVSGKIADLFAQQPVSAMVSSASCGADLVALEVAKTLAIRRFVVLPFARELFRKTSVIDRPGEWGPIFDRVLDDVEAAGDVFDLGLDPKSSNAYALANGAILDQTVGLAAESHEPAGVLLVWDGPRGEGDITANLRKDAIQRGLQVFEIRTLREEIAR